MITVTQETINSRAITIKVTPENVALGFSLQAKQYRDEAEVFKDTCEGVQVVLQDLIDNLSEVLEVQTELPEILELHSKLTELLAIFNKLSTLDSVYASLTEIEAVSAKLVEITTLYTNIASIQNVNDNIASIVTVASDSTVINSIYDNLTKIDTLYTNILAIISLYTNIGVLQTLNSNITELQGIYTELTKLVSVYTNLASILAVEAKLTEISAVYAKLTHITSIYNSLTQLQTLYTNLSALLNVEADLTNINIVATDIAKVIIAANNIDNINTNAVNIQAIIDAPAFAQLAEDYANKAEDSEVETGKYSALHWAAKSEGFADDSEIAKVASQTAQGLSEDARDLSEKWAEETEDVEVTTGKYSAKHYSLKSEDYKDSAAASAASAATLANSIGLGGIFWPETEALRLRVIAEGGTFLRPMRLVDPEMDAYQGINTPLLTNMAAYKTGKLYSIRPDDASGDFTCTRAITSIRINQLGESETVPINTPVIDWSTGSPLLIVSAVGELTLTTPATATKVIITVNGVATEYNNIFPTLTLPIGSISSVIATVGGTEYDLLRDYLLRVDTASGTINEQGARDLKTMYEFLDDEGLLSGLELLYLSNAGIVQRTDGVLKYVRTAFDASDNDNDLNGSATASQQPRLVGGIAPNSKPAASNQTGESRKFTHATITVTGTYTVVKMLNTTGKYVNTYTEVVGGTITECTWTGNMKMYMVYAGTLTAGQRAIIDAFVLTLYPEIESVVIGTQTWASRNFEAVATPLGNVIANVTENGAVEKITNVADREFSSDTGFWTKTGGTLIDSGVCTFTGLGALDSSSSKWCLRKDSSVNTNKYFRITVDVKLISGAGGFYIGFGYQYFIINVTSSSQTYTLTVKSGAYDNRISVGGATGSVFEIDNISYQELNWSNATEIYDAVYAATSGTTAQKEYAALKEAADWSYHSNSVNYGALFGKIYNGYAKRLLVLDIASSTGWGYHVTTKAELTALALQTGFKLKYGGTDHWLTANGTNETGFTALGGASRANDGTFNTIKATASFWCADTDEVLTIYDDGTAVIEVKDKLFGAYIRLVKD